MANHELLSKESLIQSIASGQFYKYLFFWGHHPAREILQAGHPKQVKALGRQVLNFDEDLWQQKRSEIVVAGNVAKFTQNQALRDFLLKTGDSRSERLCQRVLVEASPADPLWGIGLAEDHPDASSPHKWPGLNLLGFALMAVRDGLQQAA